MSMSYFSSYLIRFLLLSLFLWAGVSQAESLYLQQTKTVEITEKMLAETLEKLQQSKNQELREPLAVAPFHKREPVKPAVEEAFCSDCHGPLPHSKDERQRSFLNMHSRKVACTTCHYRPEGITLDYAWYPTGDNPDMDESGRITPFHQGELVAVPTVAPFAIELQRQWHLAALAVKARLHRRIHGPLEKEGPGCTDCHHQDQLFLDLDALGLKPEEIRSIRTNRIARFLGQKSPEGQQLQLRDLLQ
ncbi:MAG: hypothetical protein DIZ77_04270 [endosymbiont of Seepiophila jonesi]|uniref:Uncharacterized protein n=1 Tax=endosymbiont of Lamellibrachia luymesi TaxID=2200907 RepID=A0A370DNN9_9GAMM|nr:MAG: hypothetical protein DIZ79_16110 [endosymbiont of Lamellibrachia luymesi]RDH93871.1 MAG: hypothetical protein DIZ77_04270 [endosymbiont of Seepiophila jonesi]